VREFVLPPDINLSGDTMVVDYANEKIRSKLGVIRGIGENTIDPIVNGRPYADINDFVAKDVAGSSLSHKLIHVGVLDSLFPPKTPLVEKLQIFENAVEARKYREKLADAEKSGKKVRALQPKVGVVPEEYINIPPLKDVAMKKAVLPSLPIDLHRLARKNSKYLDSQASVPIVIDRRNEKEYRSQLINGEQLKRLDEMSGETLPKDVYIASTCFVIQAKEFAYSKNTKKALKLVLDVDGYVSEKVLWPEYETGKLAYPEGLKKGAIATIFFRKRVGKKDACSIMSIHLET
jgi:DNA polymerase III alpha subunit